MKCPGCDTEIPSGKNSCPMCGATMEKIRADLNAKFPEAKSVISELPSSETPPPQQTSQATKTPQKMCKYCSMSVPANAVVCPYCRKKIGMTIAGKAIAGLFILMMGSCIIQNATKSGSSPPPPVTPVQQVKSPQEIENEREEKQRDGAKMICKTIVESSLKAPTTAKWPYYGDFQFVQITGGEPNMYGVVGYVDAQNSFGAMLRNKFICKFKKVGKNYEFIDVINE